MTHMRSDVHIIVNIRMTATSAVSLKITGALGEATLQATTFAAKQLPILNQGGTISFGGLW